MRPKLHTHPCPMCKTVHHTPEDRNLLNQHFYTCLECKLPLYYEYVVHKEVWETAELDYHDGVIHLPCLEKRLGRALTLEDFIEPIGKKSQGQSINDAIRWAYQRGKASQESKNEALY